MVKAYSKEEYAKAYTELLEILKHIEKEEVNKIPQEQIERYKANQDKEYNYTYNSEIPLEDQPISHLTKILIANLYVEYWATDEEKEQIKKEDEEYFKKQEAIKQQKYSKDIFATNKETTETSLIIVEKKGFIQRIMEKLKQWLKLT